MTRIWIYQSNKAFTSQESQEISKLLENFVTKWAAHNIKLDARFELKYDHFIIISVNQEEVLASGCSIDDLFRFMQKLDQQYDLSLFDRQQMAWIDPAGAVQVCSLNEISDLIAKGILSDDTMVFNNLILDASELEMSWKIPMKESGYMAFA